MLVEICNPNVFNNNFHKLNLKRTPSEKQGEQTIHFFSNKKPYAKDSSDQITYLPVGITSQLIVQKLAKRSQKAFKFTTGKNKQAEKRLKLELNLIEKDYAFEDSNWLREYTNAKKSVQEVKTSSASFDRMFGKSSSDEDYPKSRMAFSHKSSFYTGSDYLRKTPSCKANQESINEFELNFVKNLKSYKSMVGFKNDRSEDQLKNFSIKKVSSFRSMADIDQNSNDQICDYDVDADDIEEDNAQECLNSNYLNEILDENKSVRRPLKSSASVREIFNKIKSLENKCNYCREQNKINFKLDDRNIRYGKPAPKNKKFRQLKALSQLESIIK